MKKVFTNENRMIVYNMKNLLQGEGIDAQLKNEFSGGGVGDLPAFDTWPELWVDDARLAQAQSVLRQAAQASPGEAWLCRGCGETNDAGFCICWNCGQSIEQE
jgi:membrane protease subunit (stomatin/prohibitin family)